LRHRHNRNHNRNHNRILLAAAMRHVLPMRILIVLLIVIRIHIICVLIVRIVVLIGHKSQSHNKQTAVHGAMSPGLNKVTAVLISSLHQHTISIPRQSAAITTVHSSLRDCDCDCCGDCFLFVVAVLVISVVAWPLASTPRARDGRL
jgi:hypothetical protein